MHAWVMTALLFKSTVKITYLSVNASEMEKTSKCVN